MADQPIDYYLLKVVEGLIPQQKRYEFHCHPDVYQLLMKAYGQKVTDPFAIPPKPLYGEADVKVKPEMEPGAWELYEDGELIKSGSFAEEMTE